MKYFLILVLFFSSVPFNSTGQDSAILKRTPYTLRIDVDNINFYEDQIGATPYVFPNNGMQIYPG